jgi:hypothetical protein
MRGQEDSTSPVNSQVERERMMPLQKATGDSQVSVKSKENITRRE